MKDKGLDSYPQVSLFHYLLSLPNTCYINMKEKDNYLDSVYTLAWLYQSEKYLHYGCNVTFLFKFINASIIWWQKISWNVK